MSSAAYNQLLIIIVSFSYSIFMRLISNIISKISMAIFLDDELLSIFLVNNLHKNDRGCHQWLKCPAPVGCWLGDHLQLRTKELPPTVYTNYKKLKNYNNNDIVLLILLCFLGLYDPKHQTHLFHFIDKG